MSLTDTINNTNKQKENIKTIANNIDNKLIALGGQRATNLADVSNKISAMVIWNYKKIASGSHENIFEHLVCYDDGNNDGKEGQFIIKNIKIPLNLNFEPKRVILVFNKIGPLLNPNGPFNENNFFSSRAKNALVDNINNNNVSFSLTVPDTTGGVRGCLYIKSISREYVNIVLCATTSGGRYAYGFKGIKWTAIG